MSLQQEDEHAVGKLDLQRKNKGELTKSLKGSPPVWTFEFGGFHDFRYSASVSRSRSPESEVLGKVDCPDSASRISYGNLEGSGMVGISVQEADDRWVFSAAVGIDSFEPGAISSVSSPRSHH